MPQVALSRYRAALLVVAALLTACSQASNADIGGAVPSWHSAAASKGAPFKDDLVYVSGGRSEITYYGLPKMEQIGNFSAGARGLCSDKSGNVWATEQSTTGLAFMMVEYAHGGINPIAQLPVGQGIPYGCSVDIRTGNLAVVSFPTNGSSNGGVSIYNKATENPKIYSISTLSNYYACAYDDRGNLLVQGYENGSPNQLAYAELKRGSSKLASIAVQPLGGVPGGLQWDGSNFVIGLRNTGTLYAIAIKNRNASVVGQTQLDGAEQQGGIEQFWLEGSNVVATTGSDAASFIALYPYPEGSPRSHHHALGYEPLGLTVSVGSATTVPSPSKPSQ